MREEGKRAGHREVRTNPSATATHLTYHSFIFLHVFPMLFIYFFVLKVSRDRKPTKGKQEPLGTWKPVHPEIKKELFAFEGKIFLLSFVDFCVILLLFLKV